MSASPAAVRNALQEEVDRLREAAARREQDILALQGQVEYERSRANCIRAEVIEEQRAKYQQKLDDYKREVSEKYKQSVQMLNDASAKIAARRSEVEDGLRARVEELLREREHASRAAEDMRIEVEELRAELAVEAVNRNELAAMKDSRIRSAEEEVRSLLARVERETAAKRDATQRMHDTEAALEAAKEATQQAADRLKIAAGEKDVLKAEIAQLNVRMRSLEGQNRQLERTVAAARAETTFAESATQALRKRMDEMMRLN